MTWRAKLLLCISSDSTVQISMRLAYEVIWCLFHQLCTSACLLLHVASCRMRIASSRLAAFFEFTPEEDLHGQVQDLAVSYKLESEQMSSGPLALRLDTLEPALE